jgi:uncharacterized protein (DUF2344 family)
MNKHFLEKLKTALDGDHPLEAVREIVSEYDELIKLAEWRKKIILDGENLDEHKETLEKINKRLEDAQYYSGEFYDIDRRLRNYFGG